MANCKLLPDEEYYYSYSNNNHSDYDGNNNHFATPSLADDHQYTCYYPMGTRVGGFGEEEEDEDRTLSASRSHSEAEKRRRDRINAQLSTLRKLIPMSEKMDKAALLGHAVEHIKEQSSKAKELGGLIPLIPTENDEVTVEISEAASSSGGGGGDGLLYFRASICCDDRPDLFGELSSAVKGLGMTVAEAEITSLGGRTKSRMVLCAGHGGKNSGGGGGGGSVKQSLKMVLSRVVMSSNAANYSARSKRQRFFFPNCSY